MALDRPPVVNPFANTVAPPAAPGDLCDVPTYFDSGFPAPAGVPVRPPLGFFNWLFWFATLGIRYLLSTAFTPWDSTETEYTPGSMVQDTDGRFYACRGSATTGTHPSADPNNWFPLTMLDRVPSVSSGGDWTKKISAWVSPTGNAGFTLDRWGIPRSNFWQYKEIWSSWINWAGISLGGGGGIQGPWKFPGSGPASILTFHAPGVAAGLNASALSPSLELVVDGTSNSYTVAAVFQPTTMMSAGAHLIGEFESTFINDPTNYRCHLGFKSDTNQIDGITNGAYFSATPGSANWRCTTIRANTGTTVDSGVPVVAGTGGAVNLIVELVGSGVADDGVSHALFYINGAQVADMTTNVPTDAGSPVVGCLAAGVFRTVSTGGSDSVVLGPVTYTQITRPATP